MKRPMTEGQVMAELRSNSRLNRARSEFASEFGRIAQASEQRRPPTSIEMRRMEFDAVRRILAIYGIDAEAPTVQSKPMPMAPGYYWAKWKIASDGTHNGDELTSAPHHWEIVEVNGNALDWEDNPEELEALSVSVPGVRETQWRDGFVWGRFVAKLNPENPTEE